MKKIWLTLMAVAYFVFVPGISLAAGPIHTLLDGRELAFDVPPVIEDDRTLVPMRGILEPLGATVGWDPVSQTVTATLGATEVKVVVGVRAASVNGSLVSLEVPARINSGRTLVPLRFFAENLGMRVGWDGAVRTITIESRRGGSVANRDGGTVNRKAAAFAAEARNYLGRPYAWAGTNPVTGFDCSGFVYFLGQQFGLTLPRTSFEQYGAGIAIDRANLQAGDLVFFSTYAAGASHVGVYDGNGSFIHAESPERGVTLTPMSKVYWTERFVGARRIFR